MRFCLPSVALALTALLPSALGAQLDAGSIEKSVLPIKVTWKTVPALKTVEKQQRGTMVQAGVVVGEDLIATSCSGLLGHKKLEGPSRMRLKVLTLDPELDLALLKIVTDASKPTESELIPLLPVPAAVDAEDEFDSEVDLSETWTLRMPLSGDAVPRAVKSASLISEIEAAKSHRAAVRLAGGLPVADDAGHLLGIWRWTPPGESPELLPANAIFDLAQRAQSGAKLMTMLDSRTPSRVFPQLSWRKQSKKKDPFKFAREQARKLEKNLKCSHCHGEGKTVDERRVRRDGNLVRNDIETPCKTCHESGMAKSRDVWTKLCVLAAATCQPDPAVNSPESFLGQLERDIGKAFSLDRRLAASYLRDHAREALDPYKARPGSAVALLVSESVWQEETVGLWGHEIRPIADGPLRVMLVERKARNVWNEGSDALVLGTIAGTITWEEEPWVVIERPVAVPVVVD